MTVYQLLAELQKISPDAVVLMESGAGLSGVAAVEFIEGAGPGAPAELILLANWEE